MSKIMNITESIGNLQIITKSPLEAIIFKIFQKYQFLNQIPFPLSWNDINFHGRVIDFYGSICDVFIERDYDYFIPILEKLPRNACILDVGANIGAFAIFCLFLRKDANVISLEPEYSTFKLLDRNAQCFDNWRTHQIALWDEDTTVPFFFDQQCSAGSRIEENQNHVLVQANRLKTFIDYYIETSVDLLKLDVEGAEELVLADAEDILTEIPNLILETHPKCMNEKHVLKLVNQHYSSVDIIKCNEEGQKILLATNTL